MLKKLLKYDFSAYSRIFFSLYGIIALLSVIAKTVITLIPEGSFSSSILAALVPTYFFLMIGLVVASEIFLIVRFYKNLFTDEAYLTHTLPVKPWQLITSKLISCTVLTFSGFFVILLCALLLISGDIFSILADKMPEIISTIETVIGIPILPLIICGFLFLIISEIAGLLLYFAAIALGQVLIPKHKIIGAFTAYIIFYIAMQVITSIPTFAFTFSQMPMLLSATDEMLFVTRFYHFIFFLSLGISLLSSVVFFFITNLILKKRLNLD